MYDSIYSGSELDRSIGRSYIPTLNSAPTTATLTFTLDGNTVEFVPGQLARVADQSEELGYKFYQLVDITTSENVKTAHWKVAGGGESVLGTITVNLESYVNDVKTSGVELVGVVVTLTNTTDSQVVGTVTIGAGETQAIFRKVTPMKAYSISVSAVTGYTQPAAQTIAELPFYANISKTFIYEADQYTIAIESNQGSADTGISNAKVTVNNVQYSAGDTFKIAKGGSIGTPTASAVTGYSSSVSVSGKTITATYSTMILTVVLASDTGEADLSNVTITVTDTTDSVTLSPFATKQYKIASGHTYSVAVSNDVEGYSAPANATGTATGGLYASDSVTMTYEEAKGFVDLGLPSGKKWAIGNLVKDSNGNYAIGEETDYGTYISWGNIIGHNEGEGYNFDQTTYNSTAGASVSADIPSNDSAHDICVSKLGSAWHLPTKADFQELYDNTDTEWTTINGVNGRKFMKKTDHTIYVFFPASGFYNGTSLNYRGSYGYYWSSSWISSTNAYYLNFNSSSVNPQYNYNRRYGFSVRAVQ